MKILYFGIYNPDFGRNKIYISGLKENGHEIIECRDTTPGIIKFWYLWKKHRTIVKNTSKGQKKPYDAMIVGYPGHIVVPFAKLVSKSLVVFDALASLYEAEVISRGRYRNNPIMLLWIYLIDWLAVHFADLTLVETNAQREYFIKKFFLKPSKVVTICTGADDKVLYPDPSVLKREKFTVVFRGKFLPEAGVEYIFDAAKILENQDVSFLIIGNGYLEKEIKLKSDQLKLKNLEWINDYLEWDDIRKKMLECHVSLGQFGKNNRLERTIPHKAFETLALGLPYLTGKAGGISELLLNGKNCLMVNCADPEDLAEKILYLKNNSDLLKSISDAGHSLFKEKLTPKALSNNILEIIRV